jgi:hypothetical protein
MKITQLFLFLVFMFFASTEGQSSFYYPPFFYYPTTCNVTGFSYYDKLLNVTIPFQETSSILGVRQARILLDKLKKGKINLIANVSPSCNQGETIRCVKLKLGNFSQGKERFPPYCLYGDVNGTIFTRQPQQTGWQDLEAWTYTDSDCTIGESGYRKLRLHLVPQTIQTVPAGPFLATHVGTTALTATKSEVESMANATCEFMKLHLTYNVTYRASLSSMNFTCTYNLIAGIPPPLQIKYTLGATFQMSPFLGLYTNMDIPTSNLLYESFSSVFTGRQSVTYFERKYLLEYVKEKIFASNPFYPTTEIQLI